MAKHDMDEVKKAAGEITGIHVEPIDLDESFVDFSARFAAIPGTTVLLSGGDLDCARLCIPERNPAGPDLLGWRNTNAWKPTRMSIIWYRLSRACWTGT